MSRLTMTPEVFALIAERFRALGEPARLRLLDALRAGDKTATELIVETDIGQANVSKHMQVLYRAGLVVRRREGPFVRYAIADRRVYTLCDIMCDGLRARSSVLQAILG